jgi:hypothetical protein
MAHKLRILAVLAHEGLAELEDRRVDRDGTVAPEALLDHGNAGLASRHLLGVVVPRTLEPGSVERRRGRERSTLGVLRVNSCSLSFLPLLEARLPAAAWAVSTAESIFRKDGWKISTVILLDLRCRCPSHRGSGTQSCVSRPSPLRRMLCRATPVDNLRLTHGSVNCNGIVDTLLELRVSPCGTFNPAAWCS